MEPGNPYRFQSSRIIASDKRDQNFPLANMQLQRIPLDVAAEGREFRFDGDFVYMDRDSTGVLSVQFNNGAMPKFPFGRQTCVRGFPYETLLLSWAAQPGLIANLWFGYGADIVPPTGDIQTISGIVSTRNAGNTYGSKFTSTAALAAGATENVFSAGSNINGALIVSARQMAFNSASNQLTDTAFHAHTGAPAAYTDGDILTDTAMYSNSIGFAMAHMPNPLLVAAGKGVWTRNNSALVQNAATRSMLYTL